MPKTKPAPFGQRLRKLREAAGLSAYALAQRSGLSRQMISQLESGQSQPSFETAQKLASALDISVAALAE
jgi:transcriptional regulator with XRE-family HTH domain